MSAQPQAPLRASGADREHVGSTIHRAAGEGMLTMGEAEQRLSAVYGARFRHELDELIADLPDTVRGEPDPTGVESLTRALGRLLAAGVAVFGAILAWASRHQAVAAVVATVVITRIIASVVHGVGDAVGGEHPGAHLTGE